MNIGFYAGMFAINGFANLFSGGTLSIYSGSIPSYPEYPFTGTLLTTFTLGTPAFLASSATYPPYSVGGNDYMYANFVSTSGTFVAAGTAGYGRVTYATPVNRASSTAYTRGQIVRSHNGFADYICTGSGTSGTVAGQLDGQNMYGVIDGTACFDFVSGAGGFYLSQAGALGTLADFTLGLTGSGADIILSTTSISSGVSLIISNFQIQIPIL